MIHLTSPLVRLPTWTDEALFFIMRHADGLKLLRTGAKTR